MSAFDTSEGVIGVTATTRLELGWTGCNTGTTTVCNDLLLLRSIDADSLSGPIEERSTCQQHG